MATSLDFLSFFLQHFLFFFFCLVFYFVVFFFTLFILLIKHYFYFFFLPLVIMFFVNMRTSQDLRKAFIVACCLDSAPSEYDYELRRVFAYGKLLSCCCCLYLQATTCRRVCTAATWLSTHSHAIKVMQAIWQDKQEHKFWSEELKLCGWFKCEHSLSTIMFFFY